MTAALLFFTCDDGGDSLSPEEGWRYAAAITIGYLISRGLAKAGPANPRPTPQLRTLPWLRGWRAPAP